MHIMNKDLKLQDWEFSQRKHLPYEVKLILSARCVRDWYDYQQIKSNRDIFKAWKRNQSFFVHILQYIVTFGIMDISLGNSEVKNYARQESHIP